MLGFRREKSERNAHYSAALVAAGIPTPLGSYDRKTNAIIFPWIEGITARELLLPYIVKGSLRSWVEVSTDLWSKLLEPLVHLHKLDSRHLDLAHLDPWRRILPRLENGLGSKDDRMLAVAWRTYKSLHRISSSMETLSAQRVIVHGDYHVGQILIESVSGDVWLLDLDDLALDQPESDLGNFIGHLATSGDLYGGGDVFLVFRRLQPIICDIYAALANTSVDTAKVDLFGGMALLRRTLKHIEYNADKKIIETMLTGARSLCSELAKSRGVDEITDSDS